MATKNGSCGPHTSAEEEPPSIPAIAGIFHHFHKFSTPSPTLFNGRPSVTIRCDDGNGASATLREPFREFLPPLSADSPHQKLNQICLAAWVPHLLLLGFGRWEAFRQLAAPKAGPLEEHNCHLFVKFSEEM